MNLDLQARTHLKLLHELEPAHRVFFRNLTDALLLRTVPPVSTTSRPGPFWNDVFIYSGLPWRSFFESVLWHVFAVALLCTVFLHSPRETPQQKMFRESRITYYAPPKSYLAFDSRRPRPRPQPRSTPLPAHPKKIVVTPERSAHSIIMPPELMLPRSGPSIASRIAAANPLLPAMPLSATGGSRRAVPAGMSTAVAPSPDVNQLTARRMGMPQTAAVAPAPEVGAGSARRAVAAPNSAVVAPPPAVQGSIRKAGDINIGRSAVVAPAPTLPMQEQSTVSGMAKKGLGGVATAVVPPPPTAGGAGTMSRGRGGSLSGAASEIIPPAPTLAGDGNSAADGRVHSSGFGSPVVPPAPAIGYGGSSNLGGRGNSLSNAGTQVIPPAPSFGAGGTSKAGGRGSPLSGVGSQVVPPAPSIGEGGSSSTGGRGGSLAGTGLQVVPPPPSVGMGEGGNSTGGGRANSWSSAGTQVAPPASSGEGARNSSGNEAADGVAAAMPTTPAVGQPLQPVPDDPKEPAIQDLPVNLIGLVLALPGTSYFSNYEVFVARRRMGEDGTILIKLVYEFLPYQRRLSEYDLKSAKVYKLSVVRDATCDETLAQMLQPQTDESHPGKQYSIDPELLGPHDPNSVLACYRTTADEFRKAVSKAR